MTGLKKATSLRLLGALLAAATLPILWVSSGNEADQGPAEESPGKTTIAALEGNSAPGNARRSSGSTIEVGTDRLLVQLQGVARSLGSSDDPDRSFEMLSDLRTDIESMDPESVCLDFRRFLESGVDAPTGLRLAAGTDGMLDAWPTLRVFILDRLPSVDPEAGLEISLRVMEEMTSPDEYAIALRNLAWSDLDGDLAEDLIHRLDRMFSRADWVAQSSPGLLEAIDAAVVLPEDAGVEVALRITALGNSTGNQPLTRAAMMALDRMIERNPATLVDWEPAERLQPEQRASLMSRIDPSEAEQLRVFSDYLAGLANERELAVFSRLFPNGNQLRGNRLFSASLPTVSIGQRREKDVRILDAIRDLEFPAASPAAVALQQIRERLEAGFKSSNGE